MTPTPPVLGFAAPSGTGKTWLLRQLIPLLRARGVRVGLIKHAHHGFDLDTPGKDSHELRQAGAQQVLVASSRRWALLRELPEPREPNLMTWLNGPYWQGLDLILVEGFKQAPIPKLELWRPALGQPPFYPQDPHVLAVASDAPLPTATLLPRLDLNDVPALAAFVLDWLERQGWRPEGRGAEQG